MTTNMAQMCGFDKTAFEKGVWETILADCGLHYARELDDEKGFLWLGQHLMVVTGDNPITGKSRIKAMDHETVLGWAGYIGVEGQPHAVLQFVGLVFMRARMVKNFDPSARSFI